mmetsp:Transcript_11544/g.23678  ORF Transcript_11544/g.23678 Transcript_11544/m.23678 type:complete len:254 (-) Transcript_11544:785-1546(-)
MSVTLADQRVERAQGQWTIELGWREGVKGSRIWYTVRSLRSSADTPRNNLANIWRSEIVKPRSKCSFRLPPCTAPPGMGSTFMYTPTEALKADAATPVVKECSPSGSNSVTFVKLSSPLTLKYISPTVRDAYEGMTNVAFTGVVKWWLIEPESVKWEIRPSRPPWEERPQVKRPGVSLPVMWLFTNLLSFFINPSTLPASFQLTRLIDVGTSGSSSGPFATTFNISSSTFLNAPVISGDTRGPMFFTSGVKFS